MGWRLTHDPNFGLDGFRKPIIRSGSLPNGVGVAVSPFVPTTDHSQASDSVLLQSIETTRSRFVQLSAKFIANICITYLSGKKVSANQKEKSMT